MTVPEVGHAAIRHAVLEACTLQCSVQGVVRHILPTDKEHGEPAVMAGGKLEMTEYFIFTQSIRKC